MENTVTKLKTSFNLESNTFGIKQELISCEVFEYSHADKLFDGVNLYELEVKEGFKSLSSSSHKGLDLKFSVPAVNYSGQNLTKVSALAPADVDMALAASEAARVGIFHLEREMRLFDTRADYCKPRIEFLKTFIM